MATKSYWIWHWGDYEIYHTMKANLRREERGYSRPAYWKISQPYANVRFFRRFESSGGYVKAHFCGEGYIAVNGVRFPENTVAPVPSGECVIDVQISNPGGLAAVFIESDVCPSDEKWKCDCFSGKFTYVGMKKCFDSAEKTPEVFPFEYEKKLPVSAKSVNGGRLYDFGTELFGYLNISNADSNKKIGVFYGESEEEALDTGHSYIIDSVEGSENYRLKQRALRYVFLEGASEKIYVSLDHEYLPLEKKGMFRCDNELFNEIYSAAVYTFHLNCREGFLDGIKRDRWIWAGDAYQSAKINTYLFADKEIEQRTAIGLIGKPPIEQHLNTIMDYSLLWLIGLGEHYMTYRDKEFLSRMYEPACEMLAFCETRLNEDGFIEGKNGDWTFVDWADFDKVGALCAEQMLLIAAYFAMGKIADELGESSDELFKKGEKLKRAVKRYYWNDSLGAFVDSFKSGKNNVTRHANIFALMYDIADEEQREKIVANVLKNDAVPQITTPYFKGYELDVMAKIGEFSYIENMLKSYWGEMLKMGAQTIWEQFDARKKGIEHFFMYEDKYDKSLCHAWGAGPVYIFGRYYLGVYPTSPGFETFMVEPNLGGLNEISGTVPVGDGTVEIHLTRDRLKIKSTKAGGTLLWKGERIELENGKTLLFE